MTVFGHYHRGPKNSMVGEMVDDVSSCERKAITSIISGMVDAWINMRSIWDELPDWLNSPIHYTSASRWNGFP